MITVTMVAPRKWHAQREMHLSVANTRDAAIRGLLKAGETIYEGCNANGDSVGFFASQEETAAAPGYSYTRTHSK